MDSWEIDFRTGRQLQRRTGACSLGRFTPLGVGTVVSLNYWDRADIGFKDGIEIEASHGLGLNIRRSVAYCCFILSERYGLEQGSTQKNYPANELARRHPKPRPLGAVSGNFLFNTR